MSEAPLEPRTLPLRFTGSGGEFFRIWIVNLALTVLSLGLYSAWAKVRTRRYFYANTVLDGSGFEYTADPLRILVGRLIVVGLFGVYSLLGTFSEAAAGVFIPLMLAATPFLVVRSLAFHRRNSRYRGVRFKFLGGYGDAARTYLGWPLLVLLSIGLAAPYAHAKRHEFLAAHTAFGTSRLSFDWRGSAYYTLYLTAIGAFVGLAIVAVFIGAGATLGAGTGIESGAGVPLVLALWLALYLLGYAGAYAVFQSGATNLLYGGVHTHGVRLVSDLPALGLLREYLACGLAIALSFGLAIPWAQVRLARLRAAHLRVLDAGGLDHFVQAEEEVHPLGALADEAAVAFDFDFGL